MWTDNGHDFQPRIHKPQSWKGSRAVQFHSLIAQARKRRLQEESVLESSRTEQVAEPGPDSLPPRRPPTSRGHVTHCHLARTHPVCHLQGSRDPLPPSTRTRHVSPPGTTRPRPHSKHCLELSPCPLQHFLFIRQGCVYTACGCHGFYGPAVHVPTCAVPESPCLIPGVRQVLLSAKACLPSCFLFPRESQ